MHVIIEAGTGRVELRWTKCQFEKGKGVRWNMNMVQRFHSEYNC